MSSDIETYIKKQKAIGTDDNKIRENLASVGWIKEDIDKAFLAVQKENTLENISQRPEVSTPTAQKSGYSVDPYHEPIGEGKPKAEVFIKKEEPNTQMPSRTWQAPENSTPKVEPQRQGQRFAPNYKAVPMEPGEGKNMIPDLKKAEASYVGTSFIPKKENVMPENTASETMKLNDTPGVNNQAGLQAFKVMPKNIDDMSAQMGKRVEAQTMPQAMPVQRRKRGFFGKFLLLIFILIFVCGGAIFLAYAGIINLPIDVPFINQTQNTTVDTQDQNSEVFIPNLEDNSVESTQTVPENNDVNVNDTTEGEQVDMMIKQDINIQDEEDDTVIETPQEETLNTQSQTEVGAQQ